MIDLLLDSVEQVSPDGVLFGTLLEWNDSKVYEERNRSNLQQFCFGDLTANRTMLSILSMSARVHVTMLLCLTAQSSKSD